MTYEDFIKGWPKEEMPFKGFKQLALGNKSARAIFDKLSTMTQDEKTEIYSFEKRKKELEISIWNLEREEIYLRSKNDSLKVMKNRLIKEYDELDDAVKERENSLRMATTFETPQARDKMKKALFFMDRVNIKTEYDNTNYIRGLSNILSDFEDTGSEKGLHGGEYRQYIRSDEWEKKREERLKKDGYKCQECGTAKNLEVHHITYERLGNEDINDLITLCKECHENIHRIDIYRKQPHKPRRRP